MAEVAVSQGQGIKKGDLLLKLDSREAQARVAATEAELAATESRIKEAALSSGGASAQERRRALEHDRTRLLAELSIAKNGLADRTVKAPIDGMIAHLAVSSGQYAKRGQSLLGIVNLDKFWVEALVDESESSYVIYGQDVFLRLPSRPGERFQGEVREVAPILQAARSGMARRLPIRVLFRNPPKKLKVGLEVDIEAEFDLLKDVLTLPRGALYSEGGQHFVWTVERGQLKRVEVELGLVSGDRFEIKSGVETGAQVVIDRPEGLREGRQVKPR